MNIEEMQRFAQEHPLPPGDGGSAPSGTGGSTTSGGSSTSGGSTAGGGSTSGSGGVSDGGGGSDADWVENAKKQDIQGIRGSIKRMMGGPFEQVMLHRELGEAERARDTSTSAVGMDDATRENLVQFFDERGLAITPKVDEAVENLASKMTVDWSDPMHADAIFGTVNMALQNGGVNEAARVMEMMSDFYSQAMRSPMFNRTEMMEILHHWIKGDMDPKLLAAKTQSFLDAATRDWNDPMAAMGFRNPGQAEQGRQLRNKFMRILMSLAERPDESQKAAAMGSRAYQRWLQQNYRYWDSSSRRMQNPVYKSMDHMSDLAGGMAGVIGDFSNPYANTVMWPFVQGAKGMTWGYLAPSLASGWGANPTTLGGYAPLSSMSGIPGARRPIPSGENLRLTASENDDNKFIRLAQKRVVDPSIAGGDIHPIAHAPRSERSGLMARQRDMMHQMGLMQGRTDAAQLTYAEGFSVEEFRRLQTLKWDIERIKQNLDAYAEDIRSGRSVADLRLIGLVDRMSQELAERYDQLVGLYDSAMRFAARRREGHSRTLMQYGEDPTEDPTVNRMNLLYKNLASERNQVRLERDQWLLKSKRMSHDLRIQARDTMSVQPLRKMRDVLREGAGADMGASMALAAEQMAQGQEEMEKYRRLQQLDPNISGIQAGHALQNAYSQYLNAIRDIDRSAEPAIPQDELLETVGV